LYTVQNGIQEKGIYVYPQINVIDVYKYTKAVDKNGDVIGESGTSKPCIEHREDKYEVRTDYNATPVRIWYDSAFLEQFKFSATLNNGALASINTESTPDRGETLKNLASAAKDAASIAGAAVPAGIPLCNSSPRLIGTYKAPDIRPYSEKPD
jgi:hypothetical protein